MTEKHISNFKIKKIRLNFEFLKSAQKFKERTKRMML